MESLNPDQHRLPASRHQEIFEREIRPLLDAGAQSVAQPAAVIFGGQPGAGKSAAVNEAVRELATKGGSVQIIGDELRSFHPDYARLMARDDRTAAFYTDRDAGGWVEKAIAHAKEKRANLVIEGTMRDHRKVAETMQSLRDVGYRIEARALAVNERLSWQGVLQRYENQRLDRGSGRMTAPAAHQAAYAGMLDTLARIEREQLADRVSLYRRGGEEIYRNELQGGKWAFPPAARAIVEAERARPFMPQERAEYAAGYERLAALVNRPGRNASAQHIKEIAALQTAARHELQSTEVKTMERLVVSNGSKRIERNHGGADWVASKVEAAGSLRPGVYELHKAKSATPDSKTPYTGTIVHADDKHVYQQMGVNNIARHDRRAFADVPEIGRYARIQYENGRAIQVDQDRAKGQERGR